MTYWMICQDGGNEDGPVFNGTRSLPVWSLYADVWSLGPAWVSISGPHYGEWNMYRYVTGLTYDEAFVLARCLGLQGDPIGSRSSAKL